MSLVKLSYNDPDIALFVADQLAIVGRLEDALYFYRHAADHTLHPEWFGNAMPWDDKEAILRYAQTCERLQLWQEAEACYAQVGKFLPETPYDPSVNPIVLTTPTEHIAAIYWMIGRKAFHQKQYAKATALCYQAAVRAQNPQLKAMYQSDYEEASAKLQQIQSDTSAD